MDTTSQQNSEPAESVAQLSPIPVDQDGAKEETPAPDLTPATEVTLSLWRRLAALGEQLKTSGVQLPSDLAEHHDFYAHGKPKP